MSSKKYVPPFELRHNIDLAKIEAVFDVNKSSITKRTPSRNVSASRQRMSPSDAVSTAPKLNSEVASDLSASTVVQNMLSKSVLTPDAQSKQQLDPLPVSRRKAVRARREERAKTKGGKWFDMPATEKTDEVENDLKILQMRKALDPKHHYRNNDLKVLPKYFQMGTVIEGKHEFYSARVPKKERKKTMAEELMSDLDYRKFEKRRIGTLKAKESAVKRKRHGAFKHAKRLKKNK